MRRSRFGALSVSARVMLWALAAVQVLLWAVPAGLLWV